MAIRKIARMGHPVLYEKAAPVADPTDPEIARLAEDMIDTLEDLGAGGIAGPQVYENARIVVYRVSARISPDVPADATPPWIVMINPELTPLTDEMVTGWERCLSIPGLHGKVPRVARVRCAYRTLDGERVEHEAEGPAAMILQHECDHLDGILYPMRMQDLSLLEFDAEPGQLAKDLEKNPKTWPLFHKLVAEWPGRETWLG